MCDGDFNSGTKCIRLATPQSKTPALCSQVCGLFTCDKRKKRLLKVNSKDAVSRAAAATEGSVPGAVGSIFIDAGWRVFTLREEHSAAQFLASQSLDSDTHQVLPL